MNDEIKNFIDYYVDEIRNENAAFFAGAGFSKASGYVDWKTLLSSIAMGLGLDINKERDLATLAQFSFNKNGNRLQINKVLCKEFTTQKDPTKNHEILARLPINVIWTTNYDDLIEQAFRNVRKNLDVKKRNQDLSNTMPNRECILYKMHGDKDSLDEVVLIKDDYERYYKKHKQFLSALTGDLISKTFLFVGFSFHDPNLDYILSRVRVEYEQNARQHYAIMKSLQRNDFDSDAEFEYARKRNEYFLNDLKRYSITPLLIDDYSEITDILREIERKLNQNNVFISGSAAEYGSFSKEEADYFIKLLSKQLIQNDFNIISGFGLGVGSSVMSGALEEIYMSNTESIDNRLLLRPFPQGEDVKKLWQRYREDMISRAGVSIFVFGNKIDNNVVVDANGVKSEFEIAKEKNNILIPVGCTGFMTKKLWDDVNSDLQKYYGEVDSCVVEKFKKLNEQMPIGDMVQNIIDLINELRRK